MRVHPDESFTDVIGAVHTKECPGRDVKPSVAVLYVNNGKLSHTGGN